MSLIIPEQPNCLCKIFDDFLKEEINANQEIARIFKENDDIPCEVNEEKENTNSEINKENIKPNKSKKTNQNRTGNENKNIRKKKKTIKKKKIKIKKKKTLELLLTTKTK